MSMLHPRTGPHPIHTVHRIGAAAVGAFVLVFGVLGLAMGVEMTGTEGAPLLGMTTNGLLAVLSVVVGVVLIVAAYMGGPVASTVSLVAGLAFFLSGIGNVFVLGTSWNLLAFTLPNVVFSLVVGAMMLITGAYGRITGRLPVDSPYHHEGHFEHLESDHTDPEVAAELAEAERARALHYATADQIERLHHVDEYRSAPERVHAWEETKHDGEQPPD